MKEISHIQAQDWIEKAPAGLLTGAEKAALDAHLDVCPDCRAYRTAFLEQDAALHRALAGSHPRPAVPPAVLNAVARRVRRRAAISRLTAAAGRTLHTLAWSAAGLALIFSINWVFTSFNQAAPEPAATISSPANPAVTDPPSLETTALEPDSVTATPEPAINYVPFSPQLRVTLTFADTPVNAVVFSPDGDTVAAADSSGRVRIWRVRDGALLISIQAHTNEATTLAFSSDGSLLATGGKDGAVNIWFAKSGAFIRSLLTGDSDVLGLQFSPTSELLAVTLSNYSVALVRISDGKLLESFQSTLRLDVNQASDRNSYLIASAESAIWLQGDTNLPFSLNIRGQNGKSLDVILSPSGHLLASASTDGSIYIWRIFDLTVTAEDPQTHQMMTSRTITGSLLSTLTGHDGWVNSLDFSGDNAYIVSGSDDGLILLWSVADDDIAMSFFGHTGPVTSVDISPDDLLVASGSEDGSVRIWSLTEFK